MTEEDAEKERLGKYRRDRDIHDAAMEEVHRARGAFLSALRVAEGTGKEIDAKIFLFAEQYNDAWWLSIKEQRSITHG